MCILFVWRDYTVVTPVLQQKPFMNRSNTKPRLCLGYSVPVSYIKNFHGKNYFGEIYIYIYILCIYIYNTFCFPASIPSFLVNHNNSLT